jgi:hypothetical protein
MMNCVSLSTASNSTQKAVLGPDVTAKAELDLIVRTVQK